MSQARLLSAFSVSKLVKVMKSIMSDPAAMSENIMKIRNKAYKKIKKSLQND